MGRSMQLLAAVSVAAVAAALSPAAAVADTGSAPPVVAVTGLPLAYSLDGVTWTSTAPPLLPEGWQAVPGSTTTIDLYVRSERDAPSRVALFVESAHSPSASLLAAATVTGRLQTVSLDPVDRCAALDETTLEPGQSGRFPITVAVSGNLTGAQLTPLSFDLHASMSDVEVGPVGSGCQPEAAAVPAPTTPLATTGGRIQETAVLALFGGLLVFAGLWARRRRKKDAS